MLRSADSAFDERLTFVIIQRIIVAIAAGIFLQHVAVYAAVNGCHHVADNKLFHRVPYSMCVVFDDPNSALFEEMVMVKHWMRKQSGTKKSRTLPHA